MTQLSLHISAEEEDEVLGEFQVAEYIIFLLALDTYMRYAEESSGIDDVEDAVIRKGLKILRMADVEMEALRSYLENHLTSNTHKMMLNRALNIRSFTTEGASRRALQFRTLLSRGGPSTMKGIFTSQKYVRQVREAISASMLDDSDKALDVFAALPMKNPRMRNWIDLAAKQAGSGSFAPSAVDSGIKESTDEKTSESLVITGVQQFAAGAEETREAQVSRQALLDKVQGEATDAAKRSLEVNQQSDDPPKLSEVVGIAAAATAAALSDPSRLQNVPEPLRKLDDEQRVAALTDGRVKVKAGAGSGKSTTLVARVTYLVKDRAVNPARIMACSFNKKAADELKEKIAKSLNYDASSASGVQVGTMHALFYRFIVGDRQTPGFGTEEEKAMLGPPRLIAPPKKGVKSINPASLSTAIRSMWQDCKAEDLAAKYDVPVKWVEEIPKAKKVNLLINGWRGNDISLDEAKGMATDKSKIQAVIWYEMYLGLKGDIPNWRPPCPSKAYDNFMNRNRKGGERLGDLDDMLKVYRDILVRNPAAKKTVQGMFDHFLVDECQDLNTVQHQVFRMMSEHIEKGDGRSIWMVGDKNQSIYQFRGAKPELFSELDGEGWSVREIRTNYRCEPEIVEAANKLISFNDDRDTLEARANPTKDRGRASIQVNTPEDNVAAALSSVGKVRKDMDTDAAKPEDYAVLARTNAELNDFETACIINEIPYIRRGGRGFLEAPESRAVVGYIDLANGNDYAKMKKSLVATLTKPDRGLYLGPDDVEKAVDEALDDLARRERVDVASIRPDMLLEARNIRNLADRLKQPYRLKIINSAKGDTKKGEWMYSQRVDELASNLRGLSNNVRDLKEYIDGDEKSTNQLLDYVLDNMKSTVSNWDPAARRSVTTTTSLREQITTDLSTFSDDGDDDETEEIEISGTVGEDGQMSVDEKKRKEEAEERKGLGSVQFLYALAEPNSNDQANNNDPSVAKGFCTKLARYTKLADSLRIDPNKWVKDQQKIADPGQRKVKPPAITLSTVHSVKGAEWPNVTVLMPAGKFPMERKPKPDEPPPDPVEEAARIKAERNLAYVALTRAAINLEVSCPMDSGISSFVREAGLHSGENVIKPGQDAPQVIKEASDTSEAWYLEY